jgi:tRNA modification GTPase
MPVQNLPRFNLEDTIAALSSGSGPAVRAVVRVSGPGAWHIVRSLLPEDMPQTPEHRVAYETFLVGVRELPPIPATVLVFFGPRSYTGQDLLELHIPGSAPLIEVVLETVLARGARLALPGEFTLRAFLAGKIDLTRAEALLAVFARPGQRFPARSTPTIRRWPCPTTSGGEGADTRSPG